MAATDEVRFQFGANWMDFSKSVDETKLNAAVEALRRLLPEGFESAGKTFLDIGSGSGLHSVAASLIGFRNVTATDYDSNSVQATKSNAELFDADITTFRDDILNTVLADTFDVVYSWGVLHHTGDMAKAVKTAAKLVAPGGILIIALYRKSPMCRPWAFIKRTYCISPVPIKKAAETAFYGVMSLAHRVAGKGGQYGERGMDLFHDAVDWLGGYPYQSAAPDELDGLVGPAFVRVKDFNTRPAPIAGILGTGCAEYVFQKTT